MGDREKWSGKAHPAHTDPNIHTLLAPRAPSALGVYVVRAKPGSGPLTLQRRPEGLIRPCGGRGEAGSQRGPRAGSFSTFPRPSVPRGTHQAARHRKCRRAKLAPKDVAIAGTFLAETIFATCHTLSLFRFPGSPDALSRVRGEGRGSPRLCAHSRSHSPALTLACAQPAPAAVGACVHAGRGGGSCLASPPPFLAELSSVWRAVYLLHTLSCPHPEPAGVNPGALPRKG